MNSVKCSNLKQYASGLNCALIHGATVSAAISGHVHVDGLGVTRLYYRHNKIKWALRRHSVPPGFMCFGRRTYWPPHRETAVISSGCFCVIFQCTQMTRAAPREITGSHSGRSCHRIGRGKQLLRPEIVFIASLRLVGRQAIQPETPRF